MSPGLAGCSPRGARQTSRISPSATMDAPLLMSHATCSTAPSGFREADPHGYSGVPVNSVRESTKQSGFPNGSFR